jgi:hypothetical protein
MLPHLYLAVLIETLLAGTQRWLVKLMLPLEAVC